MNNEPNIQPPAAVLPRPRPRRNFILLLILSSLILLPLQSLMGNNNDFVNDGLYGGLNNIQPEVKDPSPVTVFYNSILHYFDMKLMEGVWKYKTDSDKQGVLSYPGGKAIMNFGRHVINNSESTYAILELYNGNYIDHGYLQTVLSFQSYSGKYTHTKGNYTFYLSEQVDIEYNYFVRLNTMTPLNQLKIKTMNMSFTQFKVEDKPTISLNMTTSEFSIQITNVVESWHIFHHIFLSLLLSFILSLQFISSVKILRKLGLGQEHGEKYSLITFFLMLMWDFAITVLTFFLSFSNDQLFLIYLIPTFIAGVLFAIIELRILQYIFQAQFQNRGVNIKQFMRFLAWFGLIATYPIIVYTNLSSLFFVLLPLMVIPQLYKNAERGRRSNLDVDFLKLFLPRFTLVLYLKGFSKNVFNIQPSATCCLGMIALLLLMVGLLVLQKVYGNRIIFPKFLLPKTYNYFQNQSGYSIDIEAGTDNIEDCAICLTPVGMQPAQQNQLSGEYVGKIMTTPCRHEFHGSCLVQWMQHKMECPTCRTKLPSYD